MTLEEIICTIKEELRVSTDYDPYAEGYQDAICWVCDLLDQLEPSWHPYPEEKPVRMGWYIVTYVSNERLDVHTGYYADTCFASNNNRIIAWAKLPKPYKKEETK